MTTINNEPNNPLLEQDSEILVFHQQNNLNISNNKKKDLQSNTFYSRHPCCLNCAFICLGITLFFLSIQTIFLPSLIRNLLSDGVKSALIFTYVDYNDENFRNWASTKEAQVPIYMEARFFHVKNPWDVLEGKYPQFHLTKPLIYNETQIKLNISFSTDGERVAFNAWEYYTYNKELSEIDPNTNLTVFSPFLPKIWAEHEYYGMNRIEYNELIKIIQKLPKHEAMSLLFWNITAHDLLFELKNISFNYSYNSTNHPYGPNNITIINQTYTIFIDGLLGNTSYDEAMTNKTINVLNTGFWDNSKYMQYISIAGKQFVDCWNPWAPIAPGKGDYFGPFIVDETSELYVWDSDVYKNTLLEYNKTVNFHGIDLLQFTVQYIPQFANITLSPENAQFYQYGWSGVENVSICENLPIFISFAEFLGADDYIAFNDKIGLSPNPSWDAQVYINVEPKSGAIMQANKTLQINTYIHNIPGTENDAFAKLLTNTGDDFNYTTMGLMVPIVMFSETEELTEDQAKDFKNLVIDNYKLADTLQDIGYVCIGLLFIYSLVCCFLFGKCKAKNDMGSVY